LYIGRSADGQPLTIEADSLTTHGVIVGMTGSGKTGLGIGLIEEALLNGIPCLVIDPKGDMGNLALAFPELLASDFEPWIDAGAASKAGKSVTELAADTASAWKTGLESHGISGDRIRSLVDGARVTIYTPGSSAGVGLNVLGSLAAPDLDWDAEAELIRDEIQALVSSLLTLAGLESDPVAGPEHILLSTIVETMWRAGKDLDLATLVGQVPKPPFRKLGVFDVDTFIPEKDRMSLALRLNGLLASPSFASWLEGDPLDIESMLRGEGPTKAAVIYMSHLSEPERQFLVTLLLSKMVTWIRAQPGTSQLRALIYMDEMFGFAPPTAEPPSKRPILTILKQARAHGVGMIVSTQNPVDLDYKAMSNAGTWLIGRLQTENDKRRILEGLNSASGGVDIDEMSNLISDLAKRQFVLHTVKGSTPMLFATRWAMSYLAGPLTRDQVRRLSPEQPAGHASGTASDVVPPVDTVMAASPTPQEVDAVFLDPAASWAELVGADPIGTVFEPVAAATVQLVYDDVKSSINHTEVFEAVIQPLGSALDDLTVRAVDHDERDFLETPAIPGSFRLPDIDISSKTFWAALETDLEKHLVTNRRLRVLRNEALDMFSRVGEGDEAFAARCEAAVVAGRDAAISAVTQRFASRIERAKEALARAQERRRDLEVQAAAKQQEELLSGAGDLLGALLGGRTGSTAISQAARRRAASQKAQGRAEAANADVEEENRDLVELEAELADSIARATRELDHAASDIKLVDIPLEKSDVKVTSLRLVWVPVA
jgi:hypothetical protein